MNHLVTNFFGYFGKNWALTTGCTKIFDYISEHGLDVKLGMVKSEENGITHYNGQIYIDSEPMSVCPFCLGAFEIYESEDTKKIAESWKFKFKEE